MFPFRKKICFYPLFISVLLISSILFEATFPSGSYTSLALLLVAKMENACTMSVNTAAYSSRWKCM